MSAWLAGRFNTAHQSLANPRNLFLLWAFILVAFPIILVCTRLFTGIRYSKRTKEGDAADLPITPYFIPWIGHGASFRTTSAYVGPQVYKSDISKLLGYGQSYHRIISPTLRDSLLGHSDSHFTNESVIFSLLKNFLGDRGGTELFIQRSSDPATWQKYRDLFTALNKVSFSDAALSGTKLAVEVQTWNLVSGNESWVDQEMWERNAEVSVLPQDHSTGSSFLAEADLHSLLCEWTGHIVTGQIMGRAFAQANPSTVDDILMMDSKSGSFSSWWPTFFQPSLFPAIRARERLIESIREWQDAMIRTLHQQDPGTKYDDLGDVPPAVREQVKFLHEAGANKRTNAITTLLSLWTLISDTTQLVFWLVFYIHSNKAKLMDVRDEIKPFVHVVKPDATGLAIVESPKLSINADALLSKCPLLRSALYEVLRLEAVSFIHTEVAKELVITDNSHDDRKTEQNFNPRSYILRKGEKVIISGYGYQHLDMHFPNSAHFHPKRFWVRYDDESVPRSQTLPDMKMMRPWGRGNNIFEFGNVVEKQVLVFVAAFIAIWDIEPTNKALFNAFRGWQHPGRTRSGAGVTRPKSDVRVKIKRREH